MKRFLLLLTILFSVSLYGQDTVTIVHKHYTTMFSKSLHYPVVVKFWLTKQMFACDDPVKRTDDFRPDPALPDETNVNKYYEHSGYDRGHNMDAYDNSCDIDGMHESFFYSNMCPQTPGLNRGEWKSLEEYCRKSAQQYDSVLVWCGSVTTTGRLMGIVSIPDYCWKIVYIKSLDSVQAFSYANDASKAQPLDSYRVTVDSVQHLSGIQFIH